MQIVATGQYGDGSTLILLSSSLIWSSSDPAVAAVNFDGLVSCLAPGTATITTASGSISGQSVVTVTSGNHLRPLPGTLDTSFGGVGYVTEIAHTYFGARAVAIQRNGKIVVAGMPGIVRYNKDGSLDSTFGGVGHVTTEIVDTWPGASAVAVQRDGKIVAAGTFSAPDGTYWAFGIVRYNPDGTLDTNFGSGAGYAITTFGDSNCCSLAAAVAIQSDGKIVAAGGAYSTEGSAGNGTAVVRYNADGSLDSTFGSGTGYVITPMMHGDLVSFATSVAIQSDGKIVAGTSTELGYAAVIRYNVDGSLDSTFGGGTGYVVTDESFECQFDGAMSLQSDGKIVTVGSCFSPYPYLAMAVVRYQTDGSIDASFGGTGTVSIPINDGDFAAQSVTVQRDGKIVVAGYIDVPGKIDVAFAIARRNADGSPDLTFGGGTGYVITPIMQGNDYALGATGVAIQPSDGKIVAVGDFGPGIAVARYWP